MIQRFAHTPDAPKKGTQYKLMFNFVDLPSNVTSVVVTGTHTDGSTITATIQRGGDDTGWTDVTADASQAGVTWTHSTSLPCGIIFS